MSVKEVKERVAGAASRRWPVHFSALFVAFRLSGPRLPKNEVVVAIGGEGFYVMDQPFRVVVEIGYYELVEVFSSRSVYRAICMSVYRTVCMSVYRSVCMSVYRAVFDCLQGCL